MYAIHKVHSGIKWNYKLSPTKFQDKRKGHKNHIHMNGFGSQRITFTTHWWLSMWKNYFMRMWKDFHSRRNHANFVVINSPLEVLTVRKSRMVKVVVSNWKTSMSNWIFFSSTRRKSERVKTSAWGTWKEQKIFTLTSNTPSKKK